MNYELAKQLHDGGFRKDHELDDETASYCLKCPFIEAYTQSEPHDGFTLMCYPTLSELIESCGDGFSSMIHPFPNIWTAYKEKKKPDMGLFGTGSTPEEAVARLWLALNKK